MVRKQVGGAQEPALARDEASDRKCLVARLVANDASLVDHAQLEELEAALARDLLLWRASPIRYGRSLVCRSNAAASG